jgi:phage shock protein C
MKRWFRSKTDRKIAGVFGGLGEIYNMDPNLLRILAVLVFFLTGFFPILVTYIIAWAIIPDGNPEEGDVSSTASASK